ncbi:MAG: phage holin family protein [Pseudanabaenales cyanobacterium]|nr:phage holin family protein [Pseudanabaenales cyanobacterium]
MDVVGILTAWLVATICFLIISRLPIGVEIDSLGKAILSAAVFGVLNVILGGFLRAIFIPFNWMTQDFFQPIIHLIILTVVFGLAAKLVEGFRLRHKIWSALLGALSLTIVNSILLKILPI